MFLSKFFQPRIQGQVPIFQIENYQILFQQISENLGENPNIAWYPSSGFDTQDLIRLQQEDPDIYFHTDAFLNTDINNVNQFFFEGLINRLQYGIGDGIIFNHIDVIGPIIDLIFRRRLKFIKDPNSYPRDRTALFRGAYLFNVQITYSIGINQHIITKPIIYFIMDVNIIFIFIC